MAEQFVASKQLPFVLQSTKLTNFFDSTVDQWFKNEDNEFTNGFVGRREGRIYQAKKDAYLGEPSVDRYNYQLEPSVVVRDNDTQTISYQTTYEDLVNKLRFDGGVITNHAKLFESSYYSFAPPIDIDKFLNYANYYWYPSNDDLSTETSGVFQNLPATIVDGAGGNQIDPATDIVGKKTYTAPDGTVFTNGLQVQFGQSVTNNAYKFYHTITGLNLTGGGTGYAVNDTIIISTVVVGKVTSVSGSGVITGIDLTKTDLGDGVTPTAVTISSTGGNGATITATNTQTISTYIVEGVGREIKLIDKRTLRNLKEESTSTKDYITIERGARDGNIWSKTNGWVHKNTLENYPSLTTSSTESHLWDTGDWDEIGQAWDSVTVTSTTAFTKTTGRRATRPIIEFNRDIELYDYGKKHILDVTVIESTLSKTQIETQTNISIDGRQIQNRDTILFPNAASQDDYVQWDSGLWDHDTDSDATTGGGGGTGGDVGWDVSSTSFTIEGSIWQVSGVGSQIKLTQVVSSVDKDDKVYISQGTTYGGTEWYYDGYNWNQAQEKTQSNIAPLFNLYDNNKVLLSDAGVYASSDFAGSKIFGYKVGTGTNDTEIGFPLSYVTGSGQSDIEFCNYLNLDSYTYNTSTAITGYKYFKEYLYPETIAKTIDYEVNINPSKKDSTKNVYFIDGEEQPILILQRGNTYNFKLSSPETSSIGYTGSNHPFYLSTGTTWSQNGYENEYLTGVTGSRSYYGGANTTLTFTVPSGAPNTLYYNCATHNSAIKLVIIDNPTTKIADATETFYKNEWNTNQNKKLRQRLVQEHTVSKANLTDKPTLEVIPTSVLDMEVYKNGVKQVFGTDYTTNRSVEIAFTTALVENDFVKIYYDTNDNNPIKAINYYEIPKNLESNSANEEVASGSYSEFFQHFESIVQNQTGFTGDIGGANNYRDTAKDLGKGSVILQHNGSLLKAMSFTNNDDLDMISSIRYVKNRYQEFQLKFLNAVNKIQVTQDASLLTTAQVVDKALKNINIDKLPTTPFAKSFMLASGDRYTAETHTITSANHTWGGTNTFLQGSETQEIFNTEPGLTISSSYNPTNDYDNQALYVYKNNVLMLYNHEYIINNSSNGNKIIFIGYANDKPKVNDVITIRHYTSIQPTWVPPTPAKLGAARVYKPEEISDTVTYSSGTRNFIQCHDGSLVLKYNDLRDTALLELEKRIYNSINKRFTNRDYSVLLDINEIQPNFFNATSWTREEFNNLLRPIFTRWASENAVNYQENIGYTNIINFSSSSGTFKIGEKVNGGTSGAEGIVTKVGTNTITINKVIDTFQLSETVTGETSGATGTIDTSSGVVVDWKVLNYSTIKDANGDQLPGHWRGIYRWFFGTDRPHTHPWEMLGFSQKPLWWDNYYSWTTTATRTQLINDIEQGIIRDGARDNYSDNSYLNSDNVYKKPGFSSYVPVSATGNLLSPLQAGIISANPTEYESQLDWEFGDGAPVENAFYTSSSYQYAIQKILYLTTPGSYVDLLWDSNKLTRSNADNNQIIDSNTGKRSNNKNYYVHTETDNSNVTHYKAGIQNFLVEYLNYKGKPITASFGNVIRNLQTNLTYRCAGFIDASTLQVESEAYDSTSNATSITVPNEDINIILHTGGSIQEASYSGIVVQAVEGGYKLFGYDIVHPYFNTLVPLISGRSKKVRVGGKTISPVGYNPGTTYHRDEIVQHETKYYQATTTHVSLTTDKSPDMTKWKLLKVLPTVGGTEVEHYFDYDETKIKKCGYGTVYKTRQEVYDVIRGYGEYLKSIGWIFDDFNIDAGENKDFDYSAKEFLFWSLGKWDKGTFVTLSPSADRLRFTPSSGVVQGITDINNGVYSVLNKEGFGLDAQQLEVLRDDDVVTITHKQKIGIYGLRLSIKETEHAITLNNKTIFNDTIYNTVLAQRQPRIKLSTIKTLGWRGKLESDGYIISGTSLINNFEKSVTDSRLYYDVDASLVSTNFRDAAMHLIGYQERDYLTNLKISKTNQVKFYQGMIKQKGTTNAIDRLLRSTTVSTDQTFDTYEEWAFKVGEFGSSAFNQQLELKVKANDVVSDPQTFEFLLPSDDTTTSGYDSKTDDVITIDIDDTERWLKKPKGEKSLANLWPTLSSVTSIVPTAGYVHFDDATYKALDSTALANVYSNASENVSIGSTAWVAKDVVASKDWNVYKLYYTGTMIDAVTNSGDANTAMKVTVTGTGADIGQEKELVLQKTYNGNGAILMDLQTWGTHKLTLETTNPTEPTVTIPFSDIAGTGADIAVGNINGTIATVSVSGSSGGAGFSEGDVITFTGSGGTGAAITIDKINGGSGAKATATVNDTFPITAIQVLDQGSGYSSATVNISGGGGAGATASATIAGGKVTGITLTAPGTGYTYQPTVTITGDGTGATAFATLGQEKDGLITAITISAGGTGYQSAPQVRITDATGQSATATCTINGSGAVDAITITNAGSGYTAPTVSFTGGLTGGTAGSEMTLNSGGDNYAEAPDGYSVNDSTGTAKISGTHYTPATFTFTGDGASGRLGEIKDLTIINGGSGYQSPSIKIINNSGSTVATLTSPGNITVSSGVITAITVPTGLWNQGFSAGVISTATGKISVVDTKANYIVNLSPNLSKIHVLNNLTANVTTAFDGTVTGVVEKWDGSTATTLYTLTGLTTAGVKTITPSQNITDNSNATVRANISVTSSTTGAMSLSLSYTKKEYSITQTDGTPEFITTNNQTGGDAIRLLDWKDVRLNNGMSTDKAYVSTSTATTITNFLAGIGLSNSAWTEGALIWLDDDFTGKWGVYRYTTNASIISSYNTIRGSEPASVSAAGGTWILHSGVDYSDASQTTASYFAKTKRRQKDKIDTKQFKKTSLYDDRDHQIDVGMNIYDPVKGILPATADREITYKTEIDPAVYNNHLDTTQISVNDPWTDEYVGQVWWDQSTARYIDYESHDNDYRRTHWGRLFEGSTIDIYEWVKSSQLPASYDGTGTVKSTTNYVSETTVDPYTNANIINYYYWVKNKTTVPQIDSRTSDTQTVSNLMTSPLTQGLSYFAPISPNSFMIANVVNNLTKDNSVLQINYRNRKTKDKTDKPHAQWLLIREGYSDTQIPNQIWNKMTDSICGFDVVGNTVPDTTLSLHDRYGSKVRPRQTWFVNLKNARKVLFQILNNITTGISLDVEHSNWDSTVTTSVYHEKVNWYYNNTFNDDTVIDEIVDYKADIVTANLNEGDVIKVNYDYASKWALYKYTDADFLAGTSTSIDSNNLSLVRIGLQTATTKLKTTVYTEDNSTALSTELRQYITALRSNVFISDKLGKQNDVLFALIRYISSEQSNTDWLFKTTYINVIQQDTTLKQKASYEKDPFDDIKTYIEEVKPYKAKIRDFLSKKAPARENMNLAMSDFTSTADYVINNSGSGTTNPTPKVTTKMAFDRVSSKITLLSPSTVNPDYTWASGQSYQAGQTIKHNGGYWQVTANHTSGTFVTDVQAGKLISHSFSPTTAPTDAALVDKVKTSTPESTHVDRLAKYHFANELANVDTANVEQVSTFTTNLQNAITSFKDLDVQPIGFVVNRDRIGKDLTTFAWDSLKWDATALDTNSKIGYDDDATQVWYDSKFVNENLQWKTGTSFAKDSFVKYSDLTHFTAWSASTSYTIGDIVKHNNKVYVANVTHKNLASETTLQESRWDLVDELIYYTNETHTASATFEQDYDAGKWVLVKSKLDSAGFVRPDRDPNPEELVPLKPKESLFMTVKTYEGVSGSAPNYTGTGDLSQYMIHYKPYGTVKYLRQKFVDSGGSTSTTDHTTLTAAVTPYSNKISVANASLLPQPKDVGVTTAGSYSGQPGVIYIGNERIEYHRIQGNDLLDIVRGTHGTTITTHANSTEVYSGDTNIPGARNNGFWNETGYSMLDSTNSTGSQAKYLRNE